MKSEIKNELKNYLQVIINHTYQEGYVDIEPIDMSTHHLILSLKEFNHPLFFSLISRSINWFFNLDDSRDKDINDFNPFKLIAFSEIEHDEINKYVSEKIKVLRTVHKKANGHVVLQLFQGHSLAGVEQDVFPTTIGAKILLKDKTSESLKTAEDSLKWVQEQFIYDAVQKNIFSNSGFFILVALEYQQSSKSKLFEDTIELLIEKLFSSQSENGLWGNEIVQSSYLFYDLNCINSILDDNRIASMLEKFHLNFLENYKLEKLIKNNNIQSVFLASSALLRGFSKILNDSEKNEIVSEIVDNVLFNFPSLLRNYQYYQRHTEAIREHFKKIEDKKIIEIDPEIFTNRKFEVNEKQIFVLMPFGTKKWQVKINHQWESREFNFDPLFNKFIKPTIEELGLEVKRADSIFAPKPFMEKIWKEINESALIIADLTSSNGNVLYELGIAHTMGKEVISITQDEKYVPSDLKNVEYVLYESQIYDGDAFKAKLKKAICDTLDI